MEAYFVEEVRLSKIEMFSKPMELSKGQLVWRDDRDTDVLLELMRMGDWAGSVVIAASRAEAMRGGEHSLFEVGNALRTLGLLWLLDGQFDNAEDCLQQSILAFLGASELPGEMQSLLVMERVATETGETEKARQCRAHIDRLAQNLSVPAYA
jgi:hypothetical protein